MQASIIGFCVPGVSGWKEAVYAYEIVPPLSVSAPLWLQLVQVTRPNTDDFLFRETFNGKKGTICLVQVKLVFRLTWEGHEGYIGIVDLGRIVFNLSA